MTTQTLSGLQSSETGFLSWKSSSRAQQVEVGDFLTIGRTSDNHVALEDEFVSSRHTRIERKPGGFLLRDLRSRNGTFVNGARIFEAQLSNDDRIRIGHTDFHFTWKKAAESSVTELSSHNSAWKATLERLPNISQSPFPVLLTGPSGCGKDILA